MPIEQPNAVAETAAEQTGRGERQRRGRVQAGGEVIIAIVVVLVSIYYAKLPLVTLLVSILLAFMLAPIVDFLQRLRVPRSIGATLALTLFLAAIGGLFYLSYNRAQAFMQDLPRYRGEIRRMISQIERRAEGIQRSAAEVLSEPQQQQQQQKQQQNAIRVQQSSSWTQWITQSLGPITEIIFAASFVPFLTYFMLTWQEHVRASTVMLFRIEHRNTAYVTLGLISSMIRSFIVGNVLVGLFMSGVSVVVFGILGVPYFYFLGVISGFLSLIPYLGVIVAMLPPMIVSLGRLHSGGFIIIAVTVVGLHLFALNVLYPKFLGSRLQLNPLAVTLFLLFWGWLWGAMGLILAVPITGALKIILDHVESMRAYGAWLGE
ncbi:MAG: AI-2E family transporter [Terriglobales bacterium]